ncbi:hypothetical protein V6U89_29880 [Micromonospora sp. CPCC 206171]|uniref:hypothetical protein n=1 Tax=Micromonospora sp. CPCC 206171 TaxID=3122405 RepID=UPI002FF1A437
MSDPFEFLVRGDIGAAVDAVTGLDDQGRRSFAEGLVAHVRRRRDNWWWNNEATALAVAAVGCLPTAATAAELLGRRNVSLRGADAGLVVQVARTRGVPWLAKLAYRLADGLRRDDPMDGWGFVAELLTAEKAATPTGDQFVEGWLALMAWPPEWQRPVPLVDRLRADGFLDALVPRLFEVDGAGTRMSFDEVMTDEKLALPRALARLAGEGRLDRTMLLDGCVSRLLRGDRPAALRAFVALHVLLEPTASEVDRHRGDYLRLLADAPGFVASMAQKTLRALDGVDSGAGAGNQAIFPESHSVTAMLAVTMTAWVSIAIRVASRTACPQANERGGASAPPRRNRTARDTMLATSDRLGRP